MTEHSTCQIGRIDRLADSVNILANAINNQPYEDRSIYFAPGHEILGLIGHIVTNKDSLSDDELRIVIDSTEERLDALLRDLGQPPFSPQSQAVPREQTERSAAAIERLAVRLDAIAYSIKVVPMPARDRGELLVKLAIARSLFDVAKDDPTDRSLQLRLIEAIADCELCLATHGGNHG